MTQISKQITTVQSNKRRLRATKGNGANGYQNQTVREVTVNIQSPT